jgi:hypothetical protein
MTQTLIVLATIAAASVGVVPTGAPSALQGAECFANAAKAAGHAYGKHYKAEWYIDLRAIVQEDRVRSVEVHVGPYDGSAGGGIAATYDCATDQLTFVEQQR